MQLDFKWTSLGHSVPRLHLPPGRNGEELLALLGRACERADAQVIVPHPLLLEGGFLVNLRGERFTHENANISGMCVPVLAQPEGLAW